MSQRPPSEPWKPTLRQRLVGTALRLLPIKHGKHRLLDVLAPSPRGGSPGWSTVEFRGTLLTVDPTDLVSYHFSQLGDFDPEVSDVLEACAGPNPLLWDIGANFGTTTYEFLARLPGARAVAVEPQPSLAAIIEENISRIAPGHAHVANIAIGEERGDLQLVVPQGNRGRASLVAQHRGPDDDAIAVKIHTANDLLASCGGQPPSVIKIDVEGFELPVVRSLATLLTDHAVRAVVFEHHGGANPQFDSIRGVLENRGFTIFAIHKTVFSTRLRHLERLEKRHADFAAIRSDLISIDDQRSDVRLAQIRRT